MRDAPETIRVAERLIAALDVAPAEVVIEAQVLEVSTSDLLQLGIKYPTSAQFSLQSSGDDGQQRVPGYITMDELRRINGGNVLVQIGPLGVDFLQSQGKTKTLATPRIRVRNREILLLTLNSLLSAGLPDGTRRSNGSRGCKWFALIWRGLAADVELLLPAAVLCG